MHRPTRSISHHVQLMTYTVLNSLSGAGDTLALVCCLYAIHIFTLALVLFKAFSIVGPSVWNSLPSEIRSLPRDLSSSFYKLLKTFIFDRAWAGSASE